MEIQLKFDAETLWKYAHRGGPLLFGIAWEHENLYYPSKDWLDFGAVILGWWFSATSNLLQGAKEEKFSFMDGPYSIPIISPTREKLITLAPQGLAVTWKAPLVEIAGELMRSANAVSRELARVGVGRTEINSMDNHVTLLRIILEHRSTQALG